ncbi:hypothetical protein BH23PLA1_BH23PLA1_10270 [soil metagenome]
MRIEHRFAFASFAICLAFALIGPDEVEAQRSRPDGEGRGRASAKKAEGKVTAIVGGDIETVTQGLIRRGTILIQDGKILEVGQDIDVPEGDEVIDASGKTITPGFIALDMARIGVGLSTTGRDNKVADALDPFDRNMKYSLGVGITTGAIQVSSTGGRGGFRIEANAVDNAGEPTIVDLSHDDLVFLVEEGVIGRDEFESILDHADTHGHEEDGDDDHAEFLPGAEPGLISLYDERFFGADDWRIACGHCASTVMPVEPEPLAPPAPARPRPDEHVVVKLTYGELDGMLVNEDPFYGLNASGLIGPFNIHSWRQNLKQAKEYVDALAKHEQAVKDGDKDSKAPRKTVDDRLIRLVKQEVPLRTTASTADQIRTMIALAEEFDYKLVLDGAHEAWLVTEELGKARVPVVITPRDSRRPDPARKDRSGSSIETPGLLQQAGVPFAINALASSVSLNGLAGRDLTSLPLEAAFAVRGGADESTALAALTIVPARILGLEDRIGSIEKGKDADLLILDGPPLDYRTYVELALVNGKVRYDRAVDRVYPVFNRDDR